MTKFEIAEMMGLRYEGKNFTSSNGGDVYHFSIKKTIGTVDLNVYTFLEEHDLEWAKGRAAREFFEAMMDVIYRD